MINKDHFFSTIKPALFHGKFSQPQVDAINAIFNECEKEGVTDLRQIAYIFGTIYHETAATMLPIEEIGKGHNKTYGYKVKYDGSKYTEPDIIYYGRGFTQNTWYDVYLKLTKNNKNGWDFLNHPELLLQTEPSAWATVFGMKIGLYTGKRLSDYFNDKITDWFNGRKIINRLDKAQLVSDISNKFYMSLKN